MATVDIVVPCYNYGRYLRQCVESILSQQGIDVRVMIIDDHSSDDTEEIGRAMSGADPRVQFRRHAINRGHIATYNEGLADATADYVVLLSADDLLTPGALQRATALMDAHPEVGMVYGYPIPLTTDALPDARVEATGATIWEGRRWLELVCRAGRNFIHCPEVVLRTSVQHAIGGYDPALPHSGDLEMWLRVALVSDIGRINGADQAYYRIHSLSMQRTTFAGVLNDLGGRRDAFEAALKDAEARLPDAGLLRQAAYRSIAVDALRWARLACESGRASTEPIDEYRALARTLFPEVMSTRAWRVLDRVERHQPTLVGALVRRSRSCADRCLRYLAWRRWYRTGVY